MCIPSKSDPTMAAPGKHYMSVFIQYVPFNLANGGWNEERKQEFGRHIVDCIAEFSPNFKDLINHYEVRTPLELDNEVDRRWLESKLHHKYNTIFEHKKV